MGTSTRKQREKEQFKSQVLGVAYKLIKEGGLDGLTLRKLAQGLEYSTTKLYHEFGSKQDLLVLLAEDVCQRQNARLETLKKLPDPEEHLLQLTHEATRFYVEEPWSAQILAFIRFGTNAMPPSFVQAAENYKANLMALNLPAAWIEDGLNVTRALMLGALSILRTDSTPDEKNLVLKIVDNGMRLIIAGWRSKQ